MTKRDILGIAIRVMGVWFFTFAVLSIPTAVQFWVMAASQGGALGGGQSWWQQAVIWTGASVLHLVAGAVLVLCADGIAARLTREDGSVPVAELRGREPILFALAMRVVGVVLVVQQLPGLLHIAIYAMGYSHELTGTLTRGMGDALGSLQGRDLFIRWAQIGSSGVVMLIGFYLLLGANHFTRLIYRRQMPPTDEPADEQPATHNS